VGDNVLDGVSCVSAAACTAAGFYTTKGGHYRTLVESWNGTSWSVVPSPNTGVGNNVLDGVSCASAATCTAAGSFTISSGHYRTLIESWNGTSWSMVPSPSPGSDSTLNSVSCASATACTAAGVHAVTGGAGETLVESWNGTSWSVVPSPTRGAGSSLGGLSCASAAACTAAGSYATKNNGYARTLIESGTASG
jgi:hypothetical protein